MSDGARGVRSSMSRPTAIALLLAGRALLVWSLTPACAPRDRAAVPFGGEAPGADDTTAGADAFARVTDSLARAVEGLAWQPSLLPTVGRLSSPFVRLRLHPILHLVRAHEGIDISAPMGAPVVAPAAGVVRAVGWRAGYGLVLEIDHGRDVVTRFAHLSRVAVRAGEQVARGQVVARVGSSGLSTGPHLHYEVRVGGRVVDPLRAVFGPSREARGRIAP